MATDEHYAEALAIARDFVRRCRAPRLTPATKIAQALVDMEDHLAQARGLLVSMTRAAEKWRAIARGETK